MADCINKKIASIILTLISDHHHRYVLSCFIRIFFVFNPGEKNRQTVDFSEKTVADNPATENQTIKINTEPR